MLRRALVDDPAVVCEWPGTPTDRCPVIVVCADARRADCVSLSLRNDRPSRDGAGISSGETPAACGGTSAPKSPELRSTSGNAAVPSSAANRRVRMLTEILRCIRDLGGNDAWIVLCGVRHVVAPLKQELDSVTPARVLALEWPDAHPTDAEVIQAARAGAAALQAIQGQPIQTVRKLAEDGRCLTS